MESEVLVRFPGVKERSKSALISAVISFELHILSHVFIHTSRLYFSLLCIF